MQYMPSQDLWLKLFRKTPNFRFFSSFWGAYLIRATPRKRAAFNSDFSLLPTPQLRNPLIKIGNNLLCLIKLLILFSSLLFRSHL